MCGGGWACMSEPDTRCVFADVVQCEVSNSRTRTEGQTLKVDTILEQSFHCDIGDLSRLKRKTKKSSWV